ncbi:MAG: O-antigen ligase family protein [Actinomycetota bacterium]
MPREPGNTSPSDFVIVLAIGAFLLWATASGHRWRFPYAFALVLFLAGGALGAMAGPVPGNGLIALSQDLLLLAWCWALVNVASSPERLKILLRTWAYSSVIWAVVLFAGLAAGSATIAGQTARNGGRAALTFEDPNTAANYYVISIMIICATQRPRRRSARLLAYGLLVAALFTTGSNSGAVALIVAVTIASLVSLYRRSGAAAAITGFALVMLCGSLIAANVSLKSIEQKAHDSRYTFVREGIGRGDKSVGQRKTLVQESAHLYETGGILGQGPVSTKTRLKADMEPFVKEAHNDYFAALTERGALGLLGLFLLMGGIGLRAVSLLSSRINAGYAALIVRPGALVGAVAGTMSTSAVYEMLHVRHVWALFAIVAAIFVWGRK